jgi:hypothetical protein
MPILISEHTQLVTRLAEAEAQLAALRTVARGYCPHCGRGDAGPTTEQWEQQKLRADQADDLLRIAHETSNKSEAERARAVQRAERAEAVLDRAREAATWIRRNYPALTHVNDRLAAAIDEPATGPAATQATDEPKES